MNVAIIDADLIWRSKHRFPNLVCMKLSGYHKQLQDNVVLKLDYEKLQDFDLVYVSKVFLDTEVPSGILTLKNVKYGGTGFFYDKAEPLPYEIEHHMPDYHLYDEWVNDQILKGKKRNEFEYYLDFSIGFTTRKCFRGCEFCVNKNYKKVELHAPLEEFLDNSRKYICMLDDNILGYPEWLEIFNNLIATNKYFQYKQGMDERILTEEKASILSSSKYKGDYIFAFDNIEDKEIIESKMEIWKRYCNKTTKLYVFCGFDRNDKWDADFWKQDIIDIFKRIGILMKFGCLPYIMRFNRYEESPFRGMYIDIARWCNQPSFFKKKSFRQFCIANGENSACMKYMKEFENLYPEVATEYFDIRYDELNQYN